MLSYGGATVTPEELTPAVYIPERKGSLQVEMLAAARRHGRIPYVLDPGMDALLAELYAGYPVLVLQNLGALGVRAWHYAVVVGHDRAEDVLILRSGRERRLQIPVDDFQKTWRASGYWAMVAALPARIPATAAEERWMAELVRAEKARQESDLRAGYAAALRRWPDSPAVLFAAGNHAYLHGRPVRAEKRYRKALEAEPGHAAARNNLALILLERGCVASARLEASAALSAVGPSSLLAGEIRETYQRTMAAPETDPPPACR